MSDAGNLTVVQLSKEDGGVYECIASNHIATVITSTLLIIERKTKFIYLQILKRYTVTMFN